MDEKRNLVGLSRAELLRELLAIGEKPFRANQLWHWIYHRGETDFARMTTLSKDFHDLGDMILVITAGRTEAPWDWSLIESEDSGVSCLVTKIRRPEGGSFFVC